jgi:dephospho-CoA kinase
MSVASRVSPTRAADGNRPLVIGLTGPIAAGKSTVAELLRHRGAAVIDADQVYRSLLTPGSDVWEQVVARFGPAVVGPDNQIDRGALGEIVFRDPAGLADLDRLTHPPVVAEIRRQIASSDADVVVVEAVKLIESGLFADVDSLWLVTANPEARLRRLSRRGLSEPEARARLAASSHVAAPDTAVDVVIENSGDMSFVTRAVADAWQSVTATLASGERNKPVASIKTKEHS